MPVLESSQNVKFAGSELPKNKAKTAKFASSELDIVLRTCLKSSKKNLRCSIPGARPKKTIFAV
jgi:hypothetical protein